MHSARYNLNTWFEIPVSMGYQPTNRPRKKSVRQFKPLREKTKERKRIRRGHTHNLEEESQVLSEQEIAQNTLKRLHTLGTRSSGLSHIVNILNKMDKNGGNRHSPSLLQTQTSV